MGCARCHDETSFRALPGGFDHGRWTGFPLAGAHGEVACSDCHTPLGRPDDNGRTWKRAIGDSCAECHGDPHAGQFAEGGATNCHGCHGSTSNFSLLSFNHNWDSRFPLDEAHSPLPCSACHKPWPVGDRQVVRYKPLGTECIDCHGVNSGQLRPRKEKR